MLFNTSLPSALLAILLTAVSAAAQNTAESLQTVLDPYRDNPDIGIAVITSEGDTAGVNLHLSYDLQSVMKFHQAVALVRHLSYDRITRDSVTVRPEDLHTETWSPLRDSAVPGATFSIPLARLLDYSLNKSDNNAADIIFSRYGSPESVDSTLHADFDIEGYRLVRTEAEMHADTARVHDNVTTPLAAALLMHRFFTTDTLSGVRAIKEILSLPAHFGKKRILAGIPDGAAIVLHKTGTGDADAVGRLTAVNDLAFIVPAGDGKPGRYYTIAVFLRNYPGGIDQAESQIARISRDVWNCLSGQ